MAAGAADVVAVAADPVLLVGDCRALPCLVASWAPLGGGLWLL